MTEPALAHGLVDCVLNGVALPSGHVTFRVQFLRAVEPAQARNGLVRAMSELGCAVETWSARMIAIDVSADTSSRVVEILEAAMGRHGIEWERAILS